MKKILTVLMMLFLCSCANREDYYVFSFDDFSIAPGYDDVTFMNVAFMVDYYDQLETHEEVKDVDFYFWDKYYGTIDIYNPTDKTINVEDAIVNKLIIYFDQLDSHIFKIDETVLKSSVKENCEVFNGEYIERNGYACAFGKKVNGKENVVVLYGDIFAEDQDELNHLEIYVKE